MACCARPLARKIAIALPAAFALGVSCNGAAPAGDREGQTGQKADSDASVATEPSLPCEVLALDCGAPCRDSLQCPKGQYCDGKACTAECSRRGDYCSAGESCDETGRCVASLEVGTDEMPSEPALRSVETDEECADVTVELEQEIANVMLLVDGSGSMDLTIGGDKTENQDERRWAIVRHALLDPLAGVVATTQESIRFGLTIYAGHSTWESQDPCPQLTRVPPALNNAQAIGTAFDSKSPLGSTPTALSLEAATADLLASPEEGPRIIVLATDGHPSSCRGGAGPEAYSDTIGATRAAYEKGITTYVISVGESLTRPLLRGVANVGQGIPEADDSEDRFFVSTTAGELKTAFASVVSGLRPCKFALNGTVQEGQESKGTVTLDGKELEYGTPTGWHLNGPAELQLAGPACLELQSFGDHKLEASFPCRAFRPDPIR